MIKKETLRGYITVFSAAAIIITLIYGCKDSSKEKKAAVSERPAGEAVGAAAPPFIVKTFDGGVFRLEAKKGRPVVINFWVSWCGPCRLEAREIQNAYMTFKDQGVEFIGVAIQDSPEDSKRFMKEFRWTLPVGPDSTGEIMRAYNVFGVPKTVIIDKQGRYSFIHTGVIDGAELKREIKKAL